jgi:MSHA biogenesis protein MshO
MIKIFQLAKHNKHNNNHKVNNRGFTLVELVIVIVLLSILSVGSVKFISFSAQGYVDTVRRSELSSTGTIVNEKISRLVRDALPHSIRITANNRCLELIPIIGASQYTQAPFVSSPNTVSQTQVHMVPLNTSLSDNGFIAISPSPNQQNSLYSGSDNPGFISLETVTFDSTSASGASVYTFNNSASFQFQQESPSKRVFVTNDPVTFCQDGGRLYFYRNYGFVPNVANLISNLPSTLPNRLLVADKLLSDSLVFSYLPVSLRRNAVVAYELELQDDSKLNETHIVNQEVQIRNVP